jgi:ABC-type nickel/cobalt efflux system permease component RcnA
MLGLSGGIVPCPSALVVLLMALALHRIVLGLALVVAFSLGLAMALITMGLIMVWARFSFLGTHDDSPLFRWLPVASGFVIIIVGITMVLRSVGEVSLLSF